MNKITKALAAVGLALPLAIGTSMVGAQAAEAATSYTYHYNKCSGTTLYNYYTVRVDYNWWEETFQGKRDYSYSYWGSVIQYNSPACGTIYV